LTQDYRMGYRQGPPRAVWFFLAAAMAAAVILEPGEDRSGECARMMAEPMLSASVEKDDLPSNRIRVYDPQKQAVLDMDLEEYVLRVTAAEMPAAYDPEALKAQAVAARTLAVKKMKQGGCSSHEKADVCADHGHCQAYCSPETMAQKWGNNAEKYRERIAGAVHATAGEILVYDNEPIEVFYHAQSAGRTEELAHVFSGSRPYLVSVTSAEKVEPVEERVSCAEVAEIINAAYPEAALDADRLREEIRVEASYKSGRASEVRMGSTVLTGVQVRRALGLRSAQFTVAFEEDEVIFKTFGYGHGIGMSQAGAQAMAATGKEYQEILAHYYPGTEIKPFS